MNKLTPKKFLKDFEGFDFDEAFTDHELEQITNAMSAYHKYASIPSSSVTGEEDKDFIIQGLEEGSELWKAEYDNCRAILTELVYLKNLKDSAGKTEEYEQRQPLVWITAKKFLEQYQHQ